MKYVKCEISEANHIEIIKTSDPDLYDGRTYEFFYDDLPGVEDYFITTINGTRKYFKELDAEVKYVRYENEKRERFECIYELSRKGIFIDAQYDTSHIDFSHYNNFTFKGSVCLDKENAKRLIKFLQEFVDGEK